MENLTPDTIYLFLVGPALWVAMAAFLGGLAVRLGYLYRLSRRKDPVIYNHASFVWGFKSILFWLVPWATVSMRSQPVFSGAVFLFHICLLAVPLFLNAHNILWDEAFGASLWSLPDAWADCVATMRELVRLVRDADVPAGHEQVGHVAAVEAPPGNRVGLDRRPLGHGKELPAREVPGVLGIGIVQVDAPGRGDASVRVGPLFKNVLFPKDQVAQ